MDSDDLFEHNKHDKYEGGERGIRIYHKKGMELIIWYQATVWYLLFGIWYVMYELFGICAFESIRIHSKLAC